MVTFLFLACEHGNSHCFVGDDARCCAARSSLDTLALRRRLRHSALLSILHNFYFFSIASGRVSPFESTVFSFHCIIIFIFFKKIPLDFALKSLFLCHRLCVLSVVMIYAGVVFSRLQYRRSLCQAIIPLQKRNFAAP